jgi:hypothetical protein
MFSKIVVRFDREHVWNLEEAVEAEEVQGVRRTKDNGHKDPCGDVNIAATHPFFLPA